MGRGVELPYENLNNLQGECWWKLSHSLEHPKAEEQTPQKEGDTREVTGILQDA